MIAYTAYEQQAEQHVKSPPLHVCILKPQPGHQAELSTYTLTGGEDVRDIVLDNGPSQTS